MSFGNLILMGDYPTWVGSTPIKYIYLEKKGTELGVVDVKGNGWGWEGVVIK
jgi:hypothetical protein